MLRMLPVLAAPVLAMLAMWLVVVCAHADRETVDQRARVPRGPSASCIDTARRA